MRSNHQQVRMLTVVNKQAKQDFQNNVPSASTNRCRPTFAQQ
jgi:hypothetical protein